MNKCFIDYNMQHNPTSMLNCKVIISIVKTAYNYRKQLII